MSSRRISQAHGDGIRPRSIEVGYADSLELRLAEGYCDDCLIGREEVHTLDVW